MIYTIWLLAGALIGALAAFFAGRPALKRYEQTESGLKNEIEAKNGQLFELNRQVAESRTQCRALEERIALLQQTYEREELRRKEEEIRRRYRGDTDTRLRVFQRMLSFSALSCKKDKNL